ncbi:CHRD domain-containing protein [Fangia hongkongensis]|uniref:CHRD domain-containing protein n=1 Tax=Fangia hongkongensis TaxID=270495 RepID=UPI0003703341|nr:CHRD domain-containing protein [Fangia hongkongensis]MBK2126279.1 CHRD domain-containing protein [Fangia hongkongensis]
MNKSLAIIGLSVLTMGVSFAMPEAVPVTKPIILTANLSVPQEASQTSVKTPAVARGTSSYLFNPKTRELDFTIDYAGLSSAPFMAHFHLGSATTNGPILQTIFGKPDKPAMPLIKDSQKQDYGVLTGKWIVPKDEVQDLLHGRIYVNLHTKLNPGGEIRGQLLPA